MFRCIFTITSGAVTDESAVTVPASPNAGVANNLPGYCVRVFLSLLPLSCLTLPLFVMDTKMREDSGGGLLADPEVPITCLGHGDGRLRACTALGKGKTRQLGAPPMALENRGHPTLPRAPPGPRCAPGSRPQSRCAKPRGPRGSSGVPLRGRSPSRAGESLGARRDVCGAGLETCRSPPTPPSRPRRHEW